MLLTELFGQRKFVITGEVGPPKGIQINDLLHSADKHLRCVDAINVTDCQASMMKLGSLATCKALLDHGHTPVFQLVCRDRNRIALQSDLLSAAFFGINNVLLLTGDHTTLGDAPESKPVYDLDSVSLIQAAAALEKGFDLNGNKLEGELPRFAKGAVVSPCSDNVDVQLFKMLAKVNAGADFFQTQTVYEPEKFIDFMEIASGFGVPVMLGMVILKSANMARFMNKNIAGVSIPQGIIDELDNDKDKARSGVTGVNIATRVINECQEFCQGLHIMPMGWDDKVAEVLTGLKNKRNS
ncbi:MAG: methylenetetrahydrofolate reductase [Oscillospiraceae bacterium]|jgi:5,10-methylenetetrahydrofolate reductase|nr:methylenetetrahydrofolate reductase [Oscillospiraceae bacterium]